MPSPLPNQPLDILAIAAHRDDVEQTCGGTLLKAAQSGQRTGILDLTQGEMGTRGTAEDRAREADDAAKILGATWRRALDIPDGRVENTWENRLKVAAVIRETRPRVIILPYWKGRHPDHYTASVLGYEACFLAGLAKLDLSSHGSNAENFSRPSPFQNHLRDAVLRHSSHALSSISASSLRASSHRSWLTNRNSATRLPGKISSPRMTRFAPASTRWRAFTACSDGVTFAEPFLQKEVGLVEDLLAIPVKSI